MHQSSLRLIRERPRPIASFRATALSVVEGMRSDRERILREGGETAWERFLRDEVRRLLGAHYPAAIVEAELDQHVGHSHNAIPRLERMVQMLREADKLQPLIDRLQR